MENYREIEWNMKSALLEAEIAYKKNEVPVGAVITDNNGTVLSMAHNFKESAYDPCGHAEIIAIRKASERVCNWRLTGCTIYVTLEPCVMCLSAILQSRISKVVFGAYDKKGGSLSLGYNLYNDKRLNHNCEIIGGALHYECSDILSTFFREKRERHS